MHYAVVFVRLHRSLEYYIAGYQEILKERGFEFDKASLPALDTQCALERVKNARVLDEGLVSTSLPGRLGMPYSTLSTLLG
jgi:hypothetical protein